MRRRPDSEIAARRHRPGLSARVSATSYAILRFPFKLVATLLKRIAQVLLSIIIIVLHPSFKWLRKFLTKSALMRDYIAPALKEIGLRFYDPYFHYLRNLPPFWATFSIALPLAILEPAKVYATILIAEHPRAGLLLWFLLQGLSFVLIDKTWTAVRPQSRKIWLVSRLHAWGWLNIDYGKYWIQNSRPYRRMTGWLEQARIAAQAFWLKLLTPRRRS